MSEDGEPTAALLVVLRERMEEQQLTQAAVAARAGMIQPTLSKRAAGRGTFSVDDWDRLAVAVGAREVEELSVRAVSAALGVSKNTVTADLKSMGAGGGTVISLDGRRRAATAFGGHGADKRPLTVRVVEAVEKAEDGRTVFEVSRMFRVHHGQASGTLSRLESRGLLRRSAAQRGGRSVYFSSVVSGESNEA